MKKTKIGVHEAIRDQKLALTDDEKLKIKPYGKKKKKNKGFSSGLMLDYAYIHH
jgi:hypothetical protein